MLTVLQKKPSVGLTATLPVWVVVVVWSLVVADLATAAWMLAAGEWLDHASSILAVVTLGGHHVVVLWLAVVGFGTLGLLIVLAGAERTVGRNHAKFIVAGALVSTVAVCGVALLALGAVLLLALVGIALSGGRVIFFHGFFRL